jgi:hypothetical protein
MTRLKRQGGSTAKKKMVMASVPFGTWVDGVGNFRVKDEEKDSERPYYVDRKGDRLKDQAEPLI